MTNIPAFVDPKWLNADPLAFLIAAQAASSGIALVSEQGPIFSRSPNPCPVIAVFGPQGVREVLSNLELFGMPVSAGQALSMPKELLNLNAGLFSMQGMQHKEHQHVLKSILQSIASNYSQRIIEDAWATFSNSIKENNNVLLLNEMRRLILHLSVPLIFGERDLVLGQLIQSYFDTRRLLSGYGAQSNFLAKQELMDLARQLRRKLATRIGLLRQEVRTSSLAANSILGTLVRMVDAGEVAMTEHDLIAHANVLFMSSSEPIAVTLTWILLVLSQQVEARRSLRRSLVTDLNEAMPLGHQANANLDAVIHEGLRLFPPNAIMVRLTTKRGCLLDCELPKGCEVIVSPYVSHRDPSVWPDPDVFDASRWHSFTPPAFSYFPFGLGARYCVGRALAVRILQSVLALILAKSEIVLAYDQEVDWKMDITFMPKDDPVVRFVSVVDSQSFVRGGRVSGPVFAKTQLTTDLGLERIAKLQY